MWTFKKFYLSLNKNKVTAIFIFLQVLLFLTLITFFLIFKNTIAFKENRFSEIYDNKQILHIVDNLTDDDEFNKYRKSDDGLDKLKKFHKGLIEKSNSFDYIATFAQPIEIPNFKKGDEFKQGYEFGEALPDFEHEGTLFSTVKAFEMNKQAMDYFQLSVQEGKIPNKTHFANEDTNLPILLGASYKGKYNVGDTFKASYLFKEFDMEVVGFLEQSSYVYYQGDPEFYLDDFILIPYLTFDEPFDLNEKEFQMKHYFAMINGYIFVDNKEMLIKKSIDEVLMAGNASGFTSIKVLGANDIYQDYTQTVSMIQKNKDVLNSFFIIMFILNTISIYLSLKQKVNAELRNYSAHLISGATIRDLIKLLTVEISVLISASWLCSIFIVVKVIHSFSIIPFLITGCISIVIVLLVITPIKNRLSNLESTTLLKGWNKH